MINSEQIEKIRKKYEKWSYRRYCGKFEGKPIHTGSDPDLLIDYIKYLQKEVRDAST